MRLPKWVLFVRSTVSDDEEEVRKRSDAMETRQPQRHFPHECQKKVEKSSSWVQQQQQRRLPQAVSLLWWWQPSSFFWLWTQLLVGSVTNRIVVPTLPSSLLGHHQITLFAYSWIGCLTYNSKYVLSQSAAPLSIQGLGGDISIRTTVDFPTTTTTTTTPNTRSKVDTKATIDAVGMAEHHLDAVPLDEAKTSVNTSLIEDDDENDLVFYWSRDPSLRVEESDDSIAADAKCDDVGQGVKCSDAVDEKAPQVLNSDILDSSKETTTRLESPKGVLDEFNDAMAMLESNRNNQVEETDDVSTVVPNLDEPCARSILPAILQPQIEEVMDVADEEEENLEVIVTAAGETTFEVQCISKKEKYLLAPTTKQTPQEPPNHAPDVDVASHVFNGAKGIWGWSKSHVPLAGIVLGVTEGVANAVVQVTAGCDLSQVDQQHIQPHLQNFDTGLLNPVLHAIVETVLDESDKLEHQDPGERNLIQHILAPLVCPPVGFLKDRFQNNENK